MANYQYKARDKFGKPVTGIMGGESQDAVAAKLSSMSYVPISIEEKKEAGFSGFFDRFRKISFSDLNMFTRQLATLQKAGLPILSSLKALREQAVNKAFREIIGQILRDIEGGSSLSSALSRHPKVFNALYVNMVNSGETGGMLDQVLERLADLGEHDEKIRLRIKTATRYPVIVVVAMIIGFLVLITVVVPRFSKIYGQFTTALPLPTQILLWIQYAVSKFWWLLLLIIVALILSFNKFINTKQGRFLWDSFKLKVPVFGPLVLKLSMSRFSRLTGTLMHSGVPILKILELSAGGAGNVIISRVIDNIRASVNEGKGMTEPMKVSGIFPPVVVQMVSAGEETGKVDELLLHVSDYYDAQAEYTISNLTSLIEPILILVLGSGVLFMAMGIFLPMWNVMNLFKR
ncbi:MAG: type II secretion system F family protein [Candidatus Omnitrophica bacterium]|nr:type II secretion system F family protein [Candidatus Omnitrophota bacterium]